MSEVDTVSIVQRQLDAYNAKDLDRLLETYAHDAEHFTLDGERLASGRAELKRRFEARFVEPHLHAQLISRAVIDNVVVDVESITRDFADGPGIVKTLCIYQIADGVIRRAWFHSAAKRPPAHSLERGRCLAMQRDQKSG